MCSPLGHRIGIPSSF